MRRDTFIIFAGDAGWRVGRVRAGAVEMRQVGAGEAGAALRELGHAGEGLLLAIASQWCLAASVLLEGLAGSDRRAMLYRLEEKLPVAAEDVVADFVAAGDGESALGVCALLERLRPAVDALESAGIAVEMIVPGAMLAAQELAGDGVLLVGEGGRVSVVRLAGGRPVAWSLVAEDVGDLRLELTAAGAEGVRSIGVLEGLIVEMGSDVRRLDGDFFGVAAKGAARLMEGRGSPWVNLRTGALAARDGLRTHRRALNAALAGAAVLLLAVAAAGWVRGARYERQAAEHERGIAQVFAAHFPGWEVPADVRGVVESEHRKAAAHSSEALPAEARGSALLSFRDVLSKVAGADGGARFRIERMRFTESSFELDGVARSPQDVQALVAAGKAAGMEVALPQTRRDDGGGWVFSVRGSRAVSQDAVAEGGRR